MDMDDLRLLAYEAALIPERWLTFIDAAAVQAGALGGTLFTVSNPSDYSLHSKALAPVWQDFVGGGWAARNTRISRALASGTDYFQHDDQLFDPEEKKTDPWYSEFCAKWGLGASLGTILSLPSGGLLILTLERSRDAGPYTQTDIDRFNKVRGDLGRAIVLTTELQFRQYQTTTNVLKTLGIPAVVVSPSRKILAANELIDGLIPHLLQDGSDGLRLAGAANKMLDQALERLKAERWAGTVASFPLTSPGSNQPAGIVHVVPVHGMVRDIISGGAAVVIFSLPNRDTALPHSLLKELFDLTAAEARVADQLVRQAGRYSDIAQELGVSKETVRSHTKAIYNKTGVEGAPELITLLSKLQIL